MEASLYDRPELYDLVAPADAEMAAFYVGLANERGGRVLDLACGTGRFSIPLAEAGLEVVAGDLSAPMLATAPQAATVAGVRVDFRQLDMREFQLDGVFDTVIVAANSVMHLHDHDDFRGFFTSVARHLAPDGRLVFDVFVPSLALLSRSADARHLLAAHGSGAEQITVDETVRYDPISQLSHVEWFWSRPGAPDFWRHRLKLRQIFPQEMPLLVALGGLRLLERRGDFDGAALTTDSRRQICICGR